jgi:hypothetical protein
MIVKKPIIGVAGNGNEDAIGGLQTDHHSGIFDIEEDREIVIDTNKQMTVDGPFVMKGTLINKGELILK